MIFSNIPQIKSFALKCIQINYFPEDRKVFSYINTISLKMLMYKKTKEVFQSRKKIKEKYGINRYRNMVKYNEIIYLNKDVANDNETIYTNNQRDN